MIIKHKPNRFKIEGHIETHMSKKQITELLNCLGFFMYELKEAQNDGN